MTRVEIGLSDRLASNGDEFRFEGCRGDQLDFISACSGIRLSLTDVELAEGIAAGIFRLLSAASPFVRSVPAAAADFFALAEEKKARARRSLAYLKGLRDRGLRGLGVADVRNVVSEIAAELADNAPPHYTTIWRWTKRASERLTAVHLVDNDAAKGNRTDRLEPEVREITSAVIDCRYLRRERPSIAEVVELIRGEIVTAIDTGPW